MKDRKAIRYVYYVITISYGTYSVYEQQPLQKRTRAPQRCTKCFQHEGRPILRRGHVHLFKDGVLTPLPPAISMYLPGDSPLSIGAVAQFLHAPADVDMALSASSEHEGPFTRLQDPQAALSPIYTSGDGIPVIGRFTFPPRACAGNCSPWPFQRNREPYGEPPGR